MVHIPIPKAVRGPSVYHYTNAAGLYGVLNSDRLWASSTKALNDLSEIEYGLNVVKKALVSRSGPATVTLRRMIANGDFDEIGRNAYVFSASRKADSLTQWVAYAGQVGYAIEIDTSRDLIRVDNREPASLGSNAAASASLFDGLWGFWRRVIYKPSSQLEHIRAVLDILDERGWDQHMHLASTMGGLLPFFKDPAFRDERETRIIVSRSQTSRDLYRPGRYGIVPYAELASTAEEQPRLPIRGVMIGPLNSDERASATAVIRGLLDSEGYPNATVGVSKAPYRF